MKILRNGVVPIMRSEMIRAIDGEIVKLSFEGGLRELFQCDLAVVRERDGTLWLMTNEGKTDDQITGKWMRARA